jgi:Uma2 family endonuclease
MGWLQRLAEGEGAVSECNIMTSDNVKIADVAWRSAGFLKRNKCDDPYRESPEVVVEVISPSNSQKAMKNKMSLYFEKGAKEVWFCDDDGNMRFFNSEGELERSELFEQFPARIVLDFM